MANLLTKVTERDGFRSKIQATLDNLKAKGESGKIDPGVLRTVAQQRELVRKGYSKTMNSYHLPGPDGLSRAVDLVDAKKGWNASKRFWLLVGANAEYRGLGWGGLFGLNATQRAAVLQAINDLRRAGWPKGNHKAYQVQLGWDVAHVEARSNWR
jgi:hypothetical protein